MTPPLEQNIKPEKIAPAIVLPYLQAMAIGAFAGGSAVILLHCIRILGSWRIALSDDYPAIVVLPLFGLIGGGLAGLLVQIAPECAGSGIPQVRALLNHIYLKFDLKSALMKLVGGVLAIGSGLFMGREGPTVQVGAALAVQLTRWLPTSAIHRRQLIASGAGAGLAAAFHAPIAGVTFVLEELLKEVTPFTVAVALIACFSAAVVEDLTTDAFKQSLIAAGGKPIPVHAIDIVFYIVLGLLCAFLGAVFNGLIMAFLKLFRASKLKIFLRTAIAGLVSGLLVAMLPSVFHDYAEARILINSGTVSPDMVPILFCTFFFLVLIAYGSSAPGGLFAPALALGAGLGYMVGSVHYHLTGNNLIDIFTQVGMGGFFAAMARVPLTATVIVFEMSGNFGLVPPLMIASVLASGFGETISKGSLYDTLMVWSGIHLHGPKSPEAGSSLRVVDVMLDKQTGVTPTTTLADALTRVDESGDRFLAVIEHGRLLGVISEDDLRQLDLSEDIGKQTVGSIAAPNPVSVSLYDTLESVLLLFARHGFDRLAVTDDGRYEGSISKREVLDALFSDGKPVGA